MAVAVLVGPVVVLVGPAVVLAVPVVVLAVPVVVLVGAVTVGFKVGFGVDVVVPTLARYLSLLEMESLPSKPDDAAEMTIAGANDNSVRSSSTSNDNLRGATVRRPKRPNLRVPMPHCEPRRPHLILSENGTHGFHLQL